MGQTINNDHNGMVELFLDSENDFANLPVFPEVAKGSVALVIETGNLYILNSENIWAKLGGNA